MRILRLFCLLFFVTATAFAGSDTYSQPFDVVFDLDWTLAYKSNAEQAAKDPHGIFIFENEYYRVNQHTIEALRKLHRTDGVRVSFNSGGTPERNQALLQFIYAQINSTSENFHPYMVLDKNDLVVNEQAKSTDPFAVRYKKSLLKISSNLKRIILIDDIKNFLIQGQEKNMLWTGSTYDDLLSYEEASQKRALAPMAEQKYFPQSEYQYFNERNKILRIVDLILKAIKRFPEDPLATLNLWTRDQMGNPLDLTHGQLRCSALF